MTKITEYLSSIIKTSNLDFDTLASPPSHATTGNSGGNNPTHDHPANSSRPNSNNTNKPSFDRQPSDSIISTNSSISVVSGSNKTNSEASNNRTLKSSEQHINGMIPLEFNDLVFYRPFLHFTNNK